MGAIRPGLIDPELDVQGVLSINNARSLVDEQNERGPVDATGTGDSFAGPSGGQMTLTDAGAAFTAAAVGHYIEITGATTPANNGTFLVTARTGTTITYVNAAGVAEAYTGPYSVFAPLSQKDHNEFDATDRRLIKGTAQHYNDIPTYQRPTAVGTNVPANLANIAGKTLDARADVMDIKRPTINLRPSIAGTLTGTVATADETINFTGHHFVAGDVNSFITLVNGTATGAAGTYRIKAVTNGQSLELDGLAPTGNGTVSWTLEADLKGVLEATKYTDAVDRTGIPTADAGAHDETVYDATYVGIVDPRTAAGIVEEDADPIFGRQFGESKDPEQTVVNQGTRFFVQLMTGANSGAAVDSALQSIAGRTGAAASVTNATNNITGLSGMQTEDVGKYITLNGTSVDGNQRHARITAYISATSVTVDGAVFVTDANSGSLQWQVSRHPGVLCFFTAQRFRSDNMPETAGRGVLTSGIVTDAELSNAIARLRDYVGAGVNETNPGLTNTGNYFPFSDIPSPLASDLTEAVNVLNQEIGNRDYTGGILADGQTVTASLQALSNAIGAASVLRVIERVSVTIPKNTAHTLPGGNTYTVDVTNNGVNMDVHVRKQLFDPGPIDTGSNDYEETSTTQVTFYARVKAGDSINYHIRS